MNMVWHCEKIQDHGELLVLLAMADWADDNGICWPGNASLAVKARMKIRSVQRIKKRLKEEGYIRILQHSEKPGDPNKYKINSDKLSGIMGDPESPYGRPEVTQGVYPGSPNGCTQGHPNHQYKPSVLTNNLSKGAHEEKNNGDKEGSDKSAHSLIDLYGPELKDHPAVIAYLETFPELGARMLQQHREMIAVNVDPERIDPWQSVLNQWRSTIGWRPEKVHNLIDAYLQAIREHEEDSSSSRVKVSSRHKRTAKQRSNSARRGNSKERSGSGDLSFLLERRKRARASQQVPQHSGEGADSSQVHAGGSEKELPEIPVDGGENGST